MIELSDTRTSELIRQFAHVKILVVGDLMVDKYIWGSGIRLSTEAPIPVIKVVREQYSLGGTANISFHLANLGADTSICGIVGYDDAAHNMRSQIVRYGIEAAGVFPSSSRPTTQKVRIMSLEHSQVLGRFDYESMTPLTTEEEAPMLRFIETFVTDSQVMILSDYGRGVFKSESFIEALKRKISKRKILTVAQCRTENLAFFSWVDYLVLTVQHAMNLIHQKTQKEITDIEELGKKIWENVPVNHIVLNDNANQNMSLFTNGLRSCVCSNTPSQVRDQTGLSDITVAVLAIGLSAGASPREAVLLAFRAIKSAGQQIGTGKILPDDLM
ncbi:hypothetical protein JXA40_01695 [bacterium]|nr:hypothetical protein [candidate division CSSED10-310 bacterium]